ncbi:hypothetical protein [Streptomyces sp. NPDC088794]|uniref:hypothetical protein n=1 Tax=Streptomyces sp. NPDC088794 TaxID=3365902 RepID=UPI0037FE912D
MTSPLSDKPVVRRPRTGWSKARRPLGAVRTCLPAVEERVGPYVVPVGPEWNIVRGED